MWHCLRMLPGTNQYVIKKKRYDILYKNRLQENRRITKFSISSSRLGVTMYTWSYTPDWKQQWTKIYRGHQTWLVISVVMGIGQRWRQYKVQVEIRYSLNLKDTWHYRYRHLVKRISKWNHLECVCSIPAQGKYQVIFTIV